MTALSCAPGPQYFLRLPLSEPQMQTLFDMLDAELPLQGCDHTLRLVRRWLSEQGLAIEPVERPEAVQWIDPGHPPAASR